MATDLLFWKWTYWQLPEASEFAREPVMSADRTLQEWRKRRGLAVSNFTFGLKMESDGLLKFMDFWFFKWLWCICSIELLLECVWLHLGVLKSSPVDLGPLRFNGVVTAWDESQGYGVATQSVRSWDAKMLRWAPQSASSISRSWAIDSYR